jgi:transcriptional regulator of acetoin/glycerol metabolism
MHLCGGKTIKPEHLGLQARTKVRNNYSGGTLRDMEQKVIADTLAELSGNMVQAAKSLGISRATLYRKVKEYGVGD